MEPVDPSPRRAFFARLAAGGVATAVTTFLAWLALLLIGELTGSPLVEEICAAAATAGCIWAIHRLYRRQSWEQQDHPRGAPRGSAAEDREVSTVLAIIVLAVLGCVSAAIAFG